MDDIQRARWLIKHLRKISRQWPPANQALAAAKTGPGRWKCAHCGGKFQRDSIHRDHRAPVIPISGLTSTMELVERLFCSVDNFDILCLECHKIKSAREAGERAICRKKLKAGASK